MYWRTAGIGLKDNSNLTCLCFANSRFKLLDSPLPRVGPCCPRLAPRRCSWSAWRTWSECLVKQNGTGVQYRYRELESLVPQPEKAGNRSCSPSSLETFFEERSCIPPAATPPPTCPSCTCPTTTTCPKPLAPAAFTTPSTCFNEYVTWGFTLKTIGYYCRGSASPFANMTLKTCLSTCLAWMKCRGVTYDDTTGKCWAFDKCNSSTIPEESRLQTYEKDEPPGFHCTVSKCGMSPCVPKQPSIFGECQVGKQSVLHHFPRVNTYKICASFCFHLPGCNSFRYGNSTKLRSEPEGLACDLLTVTSCPNKQASVESVYCRKIKNY